ncbi:hypothetical protein M0802_004606 [Mischocyttarus mexicanus]|nr:hypothetical protein M0802_004606 [Mischocyttarus mexicanus]
MRLLGTHGSSGNSERAKKGCQQKKGSFFTSLKFEPLPLGGTYVCISASTEKYEIVLRVIIGNEQFSFEIGGAVSSYVVKSGSNLPEQSQYPLTQWNPTSSALIAVMAVVLWSSSTNRIHDIIPRCTSRAKSKTRSRTDMEKCSKLIVCWFDYNNWTAPVTAKERELRE